jgi:hypothetical protein
MKNLQFAYFSLFLFVACISCKSTPVAVGDTFGAGISKPNESVEFADVIKKLEMSDSMLS